MILSKLPIQASVLFLAALALTATVDAAERLPKKVPLPQERPVAETPKTDSKPADDSVSKAPVPEPRPAEVAEQPETPPKPEPKPAAPEKPARNKTEPDARSIAEAPKLPSREELACRTALTVLGSEFKEAKGEVTAGGCYLPFPVELSQAGKSIAIKSPVVMNCAMAVEASKFITEIANPAAKAEFGKEIASITQASGYVCRPRNGTSKLSEHAFGNALDIASFTLVSGEVVEVKPAPPASHQRFLSAVRNAACGPFKTVLGPGSDADHAYHFHFDLAPRRNGSTYCK